MTLTDSPPALTGTVSRYWGTHVVVGQIDLTGIVADGFPTDPNGPAFETLDPDLLLTDPDALCAEFAESFRQLADAYARPHPGDVRLTVQSWRGGYDLPSAGFPEDFVAWCVLAASSDPANPESGAVTFADPRAGSNMTAMPGLPWGRQLIITPKRGSHAAVPGWLTCSVIPVERTQSLLVAFATATAHPTMTQGVDAR